MEESREHVDSPNSPKFLPTDEVVQLKEQLQKKDAAHNERIIEMVIFYKKFFILYSIFPLKFFLLHAHTCLNIKL